MFHLHRFHWRRKRAALALLPAAAMMITTSLAGAQTHLTGDTPEQGATTSTGRHDTGVKLRVKRHARAGGSIVARGRVTPGGLRRVVIKVGDRKVGTVRTDRDGTYRARWSARSSGVYEAKAVVRGSERAKPGRSRAITFNVYRPAAASWYGPGFYGNRTACGRTLTASTLGVANKSLPCGSRVTLRYRGRTVTVPVIDRGPYAGDREYDLTGATKARLGFGSTGTVLTTR